ncbi:MAG: hypothetical protein LUG52_10560 [Clostridia bacterium]|nr:hypothetical protein [Clostridia bacterium]
MKKRFLAIVMAGMVFFAAAPLAFGSGPGDSGGGGGDGPGGDGSGGGESGDSSSVEQGTYANMIT